jgi:hypothetical protein
MAVTESAAALQSDDAHNTPPESGMDKVIGQAHGVEAVTALMRIKNEPKAAAMATLAYGTRLIVLAQRMTDAVNALADAHKTGDFDEAECHALAAGSVHRAMYDALDALQKSLGREKAAGRAA